MTYQTCCDVRDGALSCYLDMLLKLQKQVFRTVGPKLAASLEPLGHCRDIASLNLFCKCYFGRCSFELLSWFCFLIIMGGPLIILIGCMIFLSPPEML